MKKRHNKVINKYIKDLNQSLMCSKDMKKALIGEIKLQIAELENKIQVLTIDDLYEEIGTPEEIAQGFECRDDIEKIKKKAAKYKTAKIFCWIFAILVAVSIAITIVVICENDNYYSEIESTVTVQETK